MIYPDLVDSSFDDLNNDINYRKFIDMRNHILSDDNIEQILIDDFRCLVYQFASVSEWNKIIMSMEINSIIENKINCKFDVIMDEGKMRDHIRKINLI